MKVLGYAAAELRRTLLETAEPLVAAALPADGVYTRPMPVAWTPGARYGFELRACPVQRVEAVERDAFLSAVARAGPEAAVSHDRVYLDWLAGHLAGAAELRSGEVATFRLEALTRRDAGPGAGRLGQAQRAVPRHLGRRRPGGLRPAAAAAGGLSRPGSAGSRVLDIVKTEHGTTSGKAGRGKGRPGERQAGGLLPGRLGLDPARIPHADRHGLLWLARG